MQFRNDILGGDKLIRPAIESPDFTENPLQTLQGWRIARDGSATFNNLTIGSSKYSISSDGNAVFADISADEIFLDGESLTQIINSMSHGIILASVMENETAAYSGSEILFCKLVIPNVQDRIYRVGFTNLHIDKVSSSPTWVRIDAYTNFNADADSSDFHLAAWQDGQNYTSSSSDEIITFETTFGVVDGNIGSDQHISFYFTSSHNGPKIVALSGMSRVTVEDMGPGLSYVTNDLSSPGTVSTYTVHYKPVWAATWNGDGKLPSDAEGYQGFYDENEGGYHYTKWGFDETQIQSDLAGATITGTWWEMRNLHTYHEDGIEVIFGTHNNSSEPAFSSSQNGTPDRARYHMDRGQQITAAFNATLGEEFRDGLISGITIGHWNTGNTSNYGYFDRQGSDEPTLVISCEK